ncbi:MAG TPA: glucose-1-phosphate adenylyltransferase [Candidatus Polarisedimenticolia bacterium]|nr:glucose-1-phosphate adenylyltransferase [Candidatus Polarisedimenticolia bacterium]
MKQMETLTIILAGGQGERLYPLTKERSKPAVPFGGIYRIVDFTLSNCLNSGLRRILVLTQYKSHSLDRHLRHAWHIFNPDLGDFLDTLPPQQRMGDRWYQGTADAIYQNLFFLEAERPRHVVILSGDHIYKMDYSDMLEAHLSRGADLTVAAVETEVQRAAGQFGVLQVDTEDRIIGFAEKPAEPATVPGEPGICLINMGVYIFETEALVRSVIEDARRQTQHDFGRNVIPAMVPGGRVVAFRFADRNKKQQKYWRDIGTLDSYYEASMDLVQVEPLFNLYDREWPIRAYPAFDPPAKMVFAGDGAGEEERAGVAVDSLISNGVIISGGRVERSILAPGVRVNSWARVEDSILFDSVQVGRRCRIRRTIIDKSVTVPPGMVIGHDPDADARRFTISPGGVVVIPKGADLTEV